MRVFLDALYVFLDGEVHLASEDGAPSMNLGGSGGGSGASPMRTTFGTRGGVAFPTIGGSGSGGGSVFFVGGAGEGDVDVEAIDIRDNVRIVLYSF